MTGLALFTLVLLAGRAQVNVQAHRSDPPFDLVSAEASIQAGGPEAAATVANSAPDGAGAVYNLRVASDASPDLTDLDSFIHSTTSQSTSPPDKVMSLFYWTHILKRQTSPMVLHGLEVTDPIRNFTDYGFTMCSTISGINQRLYHALGLPHQYWDICNHTVSTVAYDGKFRMIDSSMSNLVTTDDGVSLASLQEAAADSARLVRERSLYSTAPGGFLSGTDALRSLGDAINPADGTVVKGFAANFCENGLKLRDYYYNWDGGHRYVLNLRKNESYTRYYRRLGSTPDYWVGSERINGPNPNDTFEIDASGRFGNRGNGHWSFTPPLSAEWDRTTHAATNIASAVGGGLQPAAPGVPADVVYKVQGANAIASQMITASFTLNDPAAKAAISLSVNHGLTWTDLALVAQRRGVVPLTVNLRDQVNGAYETLIRFSLTGPATGSAAAIVLTDVRIDTVTHLNVHGLPKLNVGRNEIFVGIGDQSDTMVLWPDLRGSLWQNTALEASNVASQDVSVPRKYTAVIYPSVPTQDAYLTYRMEAPRDLTRVVYGGRLYNTTPGSYIDFLHSFDEGATWIRSYRMSDVSKPYDVIHYETVTDIPAGVRAVRFRFLIHNTGTGAKASGLYSVRMEANHQPQATQTAPVEVTLRWKEVQPNRTTILRSHKQIIDRFPARYIVNVAGSDHPVMEAMTLNIVGSGDTSPVGYGDGIDPGGIKHLQSTRIDGINLAQNRPYTFSRAPSEFQLSAGGNNHSILTDGVVGAPATGGISYWWGQCWSSGTDVDLQVDLGSPRAIGAFRAHLFGYPGWDAFKGQVQDRIEIQSSIDGIAFVSHGILQTALWRKDIPINHMLPDDGKATAWNFERIVTSPVTARYVRYHITPRRNLCATELQVLDRVTYETAARAVAPPKWLQEPASLNLAPTVVLTSPQSGDTLSARDITLSADATDPDGGVQVVQFFANGLLVGSASSAPYAVSWTGIPAGPYTISARATDFAGASTTSAVIRVNVEPRASQPATGDDIVLHAAVNPHIIGGWVVTSDVTAASGARLQNPNADMAKVLSPLPTPTQAFELTFNAEARRPYRLWLRGKALANSYNNDSVYVQFERSVDAVGNPVARIGTSSATTVVLEECSGCGVQGWGWSDNGYGPQVLGPLVYFDASGPQRLRVQVREDGLGIDQVVLSAVEYVTTAPGAAQNDTTILEPTVTDAGPSPSVDEVVLYAAGDAEILGGWTVVEDATAAAGARLQNPNMNAPKLGAASPDPAHAFDLTFSADAGKPYRLWIRGKAEKDSYHNDSVFVQFDNSVDGSGGPVWRIGTSSSTTFVLEECGGCGVQGWGWTDNGYGSEVLGPVVHFARSGLQRLRIQVREDGLAVDQVVLSAVKYLVTSPGSPRNDGVLVPR